MKLVEFESQADDILSRSGLQGVLLDGEKDAAEFAARLGAYTAQLGQRQDPTLKLLAQDEIPTIGRMIAELNSGIASGEIGSQTFLFETQTRLASAFARAAFALESPNADVIKPSIDEILWGVPVGRATVEEDDVDGYKAPYRDQQPSKPFGEQQESFIYIEPQPRRYGRYVSV